MTTYKHTSMRLEDNIGHERTKEKKKGGKQERESYLRSIFWQLKPDGIVHDNVRPAHQTAQPPVHDVYGPKHSLASLVNHSSVDAQQDADVHGSRDMHIGGIFPVHLDQIG